MRALPLTCAAAGANSGSEGARAKQLLKAREEEKVAMQATKDLAEKERSTRTANISSKFSGQVESAKMGGIQGAYGLVTLKELKAGGAAPARLPVAAGSA